MIRAQKHFLYNRKSTFPRYFAQSIYFSCHQWFPKERFFFSTSHFELIEVISHRYWMVFFVPHGYMFDFHLKLLVKLESSAQKQESLAIPITPILISVPRILFLEHRKKKNCYMAKSFHDKTLNAVEFYRNTCTKSKKNTLKNL